MGTFGRMRENEMSKTVLITPCFAKAALLRDLLEFLALNPPGIDHYILGNHYPINRHTNNDEIRCLANDYGCKFIDSIRDLGLHHSLNNAVKQIGLDDDDIVITVDPDDRPTPGFVDAINNVMRWDDKLAVLALNFWVIDERIKEQKLAQELILGHSVCIHPSVEMFTIAAFNMRFINSIGGFDEPLPYYGGLESYLHSKWAPMGMRLGYLEHYRADAAPVDRGDPNLFDPEFRLWKNAHVAGYKGGFEEWLKEFKPEKS